MPQGTLEAHGGALLADFLRLALYVSRGHEGQPTQTADALRALRAGHSTGDWRVAARPGAAAAQGRGEQRGRAAGATAALRSGKPRRAGRSSSSSGKGAGTEGRMPHAFRATLVGQTRRQAAAVDGRLAGLLPPPPTVSPPGGSAGPGGGGSPDQQALARAAFAAATARDPRRSLSRRLSLSHRALLNAVSSEGFRRHIAGAVEAGQRAQRAGSGSARARVGAQGAQAEAYAALAQALLAGR